MNQVFSYQLLKEKFNETEESFGATTNQNYRTARDDIIEDSILKKTFC